MSNTSDRAMVAIVELGGKQYVVSAGQKIRVNRLSQAEGTLKLKSLIDELPVELRILQELKDKKVRGLKFKNKIRYIRHYGHRQLLTELEVISVGEKTTAKAVETAPVEKPKAEKAAASAAKPAAKKPAAKKPVAKKEKND